MVYFSLYKKLSTYKKVEALILILNIKDFIVIKLIRILSEVYETRYDKCSYNLTSSSFLSITKYKLLCKLSIK